MRAASTSQTDNADIDSIVRAKDPRRRSRRDSNGPDKRPSILVLHRNYLPDQLYPVLQRLLERGCGFLKDSAIVS